MGNKKRRRVKVFAVRTRTKIGRSEVDSVVFHCEELGVNSLGLAVTGGCIVLFNSNDPKSPKFTPSDIAVLAMGIKTKECAQLLTDNGLDASALSCLAR